MADVGWVATDHGKALVWNHYSFSTSLEANDVTMETAGTLAQLVIIGIATSESVVLLSLLQVYGRQLYELLHALADHGFQSELQLPPRCWTAFQPKLSTEQCVQRV